MKTGKNRIWIMSFDIFTCDGKGILVDGCVMGFRLADVDVCLIFGYYTAVLIIEMRLQMAPNYRRLFGIQTLIELVKLATLTWLC